jgi:hypothetical protein
LDRTLRTKTSTHQQLSNLLQETQKNPCPYPPNVLTWNLNITYLPDFASSFLIHPAWFTTNGERQSVIL